MIADFLKFWWDVAPFMLVRDAVLAVAGICWCIWLVMERK